MSLKGKDFCKMLNYEGVLIAFVETSRRFHLLSSRLTIMWRSVSSLFILNGVPCLLNVLYILKYDLFSHSLRNHLGKSAVPKLRKLSCTGLLATRTHNNILIG